MRITLLLLTLSFFVGCGPSHSFDEAAARAEILELEERQREVHFQKRAKEFAELLAPDHISVNRGLINEPSTEELEERFQGYFNQVEFLRWDDVQLPRVYFSDDGSLAYTIIDKEVIVQYADSVGLIQVRTPFAWTSIYRRYEGEWKIASVTSTNRESEYDTLRNIVAVADCEGPRDTYQTEMHSRPDGYLFFQQTFSDRDPSFQAVIFSDSVGYALKGDQAPSDPLSLEVISMLQGHNVFWMRMRPSLFFRNIERDSTGLQAQAEDQLGNPVSLHFDPQYYRLEAVQLQNPMELSEDIEVYFDEEMDSDFGKLPKRVRFIQGHRDTFFFEFTQVELNASQGRFLENN